MRFHKRRGVAILRFGNQSASARGTARQAQVMESRPGFAFIAPLGIFLLIALTGARSASAQKKYTPEHPVVQEMIERAVEYIAADPSRDFGENVVFAMAAYKSGIITGKEDPKSHPLIERALARVELLSGEGLAKSGAFRTMYASALACVFLLELDAKKYEPKIRILLDHIANRQQAAGAWGYKDYPQVGDTSQMQYIALALWLAKHHGYQVDPEICKRALEWMIEWQMDDGGWIYQQPTGIVSTVGPGARTVRHSLVAAGLGTVYLYADFLQLFDRQTGRLNIVRDDVLLELPIAVYEITDDAASEQSQGDRRPLVAFESGRARSTMTRGNSWFTQNFAVEVDEYNLYYLYGFERYISMRQYLDGDIGKGGGIDTWYDDGVDFLRSIQQADGHFDRSSSEISDSVNTAFGVLFLTQSMSITLGDSSTGLQNGIGDLPDNVILQEAEDGGGIRSGSIERSVTEFLSIMDTSETSEVEMFTNALTGLELGGDDAAGGQQLAKLRMLVRHENWQARLVTIKYLARQRSLDNVPALVFALTDPDPKIVQEANQGLMFVSRRTTGPKLSEEPTRSEKQAAIQEWTVWFKHVRPDGRLLELPEEF